VAVPLLVPVVAPEAPALVLVPLPPGAELPEEAPEVPVPAPEFPVASLELPLLLSQAAKAKATRRAVSAVDLIFMPLEIVHLLQIGHAAGPAAAPQSTKLTSH